jgi:transcriptional regulator with XRE-family HTH domain
MGTDFKDYLNQKLKNPGFKVEYDALEPECAIIQAMIDARKDANFSQKELAKKTGINQADISKIENGNANPSLKTLKRLACGLNKRLKIEFLPLNKHTISSYR